MKYVLNKQNATDAYFITEGEYIVQCNTIIKTQNLSALIDVMANSDMVTLTIKIPKVWCYNQVIEFDNYLDLKELFPEYFI